MADYIAPALALLVVGGMAAVVLWVLDGCKSWQQLMAENRQQLAEAAIRDTICKAKRNMERAVQSQSGPITVTISRKGVRRCSPN